MDHRRRQSREPRGRSREPRQHSRESRRHSQERQEDRGRQEHVERQGDGKSDTPTTPYPTVTFSSQSPYQIQIANPPQRVTRVYRTDNHPLWAATPRHLPGRSPTQPEELRIPSPSEQMKLQNKAANKTREDTDPHPL